MEWGGESRLEQQKVTIHFNLITTRQQSLGKVMFHKPVCVCPLRGWVAIQRWYFRGVGMSWGGYSPPPHQTGDLGYKRIRLTSGLYASYWIAFLCRNYVESFCNLVKVYWMFAPPSSACEQHEVSCNKCSMKARHWSTLLSSSSHCMPEADSTVLLWQ